MLDIAVRLQRVRVVENIRPLLDLSEKEIS